jgi:hypothetical protein
LFILPLFTFYSEFTNLQFSESIYERCKKPEQYLLPLMAIEQQEDG